MKKCAFCWFFLHMYITMHGSENVKHSMSYCLIVSLLLALAFCSSLCSN